jgi:hypothetical protein
MIMTAIVEKMSKDELKQYLECFDRLDDAKRNLLCEQELLIKSLEDLYLVLERVEEARKIRDRNVSRKEEYEKTINDKYMPSFLDHSEEENS